MITDPSAILVICASLRKGVTFFLSQKGTFSAGSLLFSSSLRNPWEYQGKYIYAKSYYQKALSIGEKALGPKHPAVTNSLNNLATLYSEQHDYTQAEPLYQRALSIREQTLGMEHPDTLGCMISYRNMLLAAKRNKKAAELTIRIEAIQATLAYDNESDDSSQ